MKIFGREPAIWLGLLQGVLGAALALNVLHLSAENSTLAQAASGAVFALAAAYLTKQVNLAVVVGAVQSVLALLVGFGLDLSPDQTASLIAGVQLALAGFLRQNTEPAHEPGFNSEPLATEPLEPEVEHAPVPAPVVVTEEVVPAESTTGHDADGMPEEEPYV